ncbi:MAG: LptF/LptG family permease [Bacteroidota bacterium]
MKKIDRYILYKYFTSFIFCIFLFTAIVVVIDMSEHTEDFAKSGLSASRIFSDFYLGLIPRIDAMLFPLFVFISVIFFTAKMAGNSEIVAILSSGVSFRRFLFPYFIGGLVLSLTLWFGYKYVVPNANRKWAEFVKKYIDVNVAPNPLNSTYKQNVYFRIDSNTYAGIKGYDTVSKSGTNLSVQRVVNNKVVYNLRAMNFRWDTASKKWSLNNVLERKLNAIDEQVSFYHNKEMRYSFKPIDLRKDEYLKDQMTTPELDNFIELERMRGSEMLNTLEVERYNRDAIPVSVLILTLIGGILASRRVRGGSGIHLALGIVISVSYVLFSRFSIVFATKGNFTPWLAAWIPNILFGILVVYLYKKAPK